MAAAAPPSRAVTSRRMCRTDTWRPELRPPVGEAFEIALFYGKHFFLGPLGDSSQTLWKTEGSVPQGRYYPGTPAITAGPRAGRPPLTQALRGLYVSDEDSIRQQPHLPRSR